jgi:hypothetical protein
MHHFRSFNRFILIGLALLGLFVSSAQAALVTEIRGLDVDGTMYDVTFHPGSSFDELWDNHRNNFYGELAFYDSAPQFWFNFDGAIAAADAIMAFLGDTHWTIPAIPEHDSFFVPWGYCKCDGPHYVQDLRVRNIFDFHFDLRTDSWSNIDYQPNFPGYPYASFQEVSAVPVPAAVWLFGTALIGLVGFSKRKSGIVT